MTTYIDVLEAQLNALKVEYEYMCDSDFYDDRDCERLLDLITEKKAEIEKAKEAK